MGHHLEAQIGNPGVSRPWHFPLSCSISNLQLSPVVLNSWICFQSTQFSAVLDHHSPGLCLSPGIDPLYCYAVLSVPLWFLGICGLEQSQSRFYIIGFLRAFGMLIMATRIPQGGGLYFACPKLTQSFLDPCSPSLPCPCIQSPHGSQIDLCWLPSWLCSSANTPPATLPLWCLHMCRTHHWCPAPLPFTRLLHPSPDAAALTTDAHSCLFWGTTCQGGYFPPPSRTSHNQGWLGG